MKRLLATLLAVTMCISFLPTFASAEVGDSFVVDLCEVKGYMNSTVTGTNWKVDTENSQPELVDGTTAAVRVQAGTKDGAPWKFATIYSGYEKGLAVNFTAPKTGYYKVIADITPYRLGGKKTEVYVNGVLLGEISTFGSVEEWPDQFYKATTQEVGIVRLKAGEYANTVEVKGTDGNIYMQGFTFVEVEPVATAFNYNFYEKIDKLKVNGAKDVASQTGKDIVVVAEESSSFQGDRREYTAEGVNYVQYDLGNASTTWIASNNSKEKKWTFKFPIGVAGWYSIDMQGCYWYANDMFYLYADDQFAGIYDFSNGLKKAVDAKQYLGDKKVLNTLYLTPDEDGYVKFSLNYAKGNEYGRARLAPISINVTPVEVADKLTCVDIVHTIPETMAFGETREFEAYAVMSDGSRRHINGYKSDATVDSGNSISVSGNASIERSLNSLYDDGTYTGSITPTGIGATTITLTAKVDGNVYTETANINVSAPSKPVAFSLPLSGEETAVNEKDGQYGSPNEWKVLGASVVLDKTTADKSRRYHYGEVKINQFITAGIYNVWPNLASDAKETMITFKKTVPYEGYYDISFTGYTWNLNADYSIYINGEYAGQTSCYDASATPLSNCTTKTSALNTLYLPAGDVEISFRARKSHYESGTSFFTPKSLDFVPSEDSEITITEVKTSDIPATMEAGASYEGTAQALMNNSELRSFGFTNSGDLPATDEVIKVSSSNSAIVAVTDVECVKVLTSEENKDLAITIDPTTTTYSLKALRAGSADITVTAIVDGKEKSVTKTVTVSGEAMEETITKTGASVSILPLEGGTVTTSLGSIVDNVPFGTIVSAEAKANAGYVFAYWQNSNGAVVSENAEETFVINTNTSIKAYFEKIVSEDDAEVPVYFYNGNGEPLATKKVEKKSIFGDIKIEAPSLTGYVFDCWSVADDAEINSVTRAVALYNDSDATYTLEVNDGVNSASQSGKKYGETVTVTAKGAGTFSFWTLGDDIVSYSKTFTMTVYGDATLTAVYGTAVEAVPTVALEEVDGSYFLTYNIPTGFEKIEAGILFSESGTPRVGSSYSKAIAKTNKSQFTAMPYGDGDTIARGYVMYRDGNDIKVIYAK